MGFHSHYLSSSFSQAFHAVAVCGQMINAHCQTEISNSAAHHHSNAHRCCHSPGIRQMRGPNCLGKARGGASTPSSGNTHPGRWPSRILAAASTSTEVPSPPELLAEITSGSFWIAVRRSSDCATVRVWVVRCRRWCVASVRDAGEDGAFIRPRVRSCLGEMRENKRKITIAWTTIFSWKMTK